MKKPIILITALSLLLLCMTGCGAAKTVPDKTIEWEIEDYLKSAPTMGGAYTDYSSEVKHDPDHDTKTDTVSVELTITYPHCIAGVTYEATYQYDKASDLWTVIRGGKWETFHVNRYDIAASCKLWLNEMNRVGFNSTTMLQGKDEMSNVIADDYPELGDLVIDGWNNEGYYPDINGWQYESQLNVYCFETNRMEDAKLLYDAENESVRSVEWMNLIDNAEGDNYVFSRYMDSDGEEFWFLIQTDQFLIALASDIRDQQHYSLIEALLSQLGFDALKIIPRHWN